MLFGLIDPFTSVVMSTTKLILPETDIFAAKMIQHEEIDKSSPYNLTNFTNPLNSSIEAVNMYPHFQGSHQ